MNTNNENGVVTNESSYTKISWKSIRMVCIFMSLLLITLTFVFYVIPKAWESYEIGSFFDHHENWKNTSVNQLGIILYFLIGYVLAGLTLIVFLYFQLGRIKRINQGGLIDSLIFGIICAIILGSLFFFISKPIGMGGEPVSRLILCFVWCIIAAFISISILGTSMEFDE